MPKIYKPKQNDEFAFGADAMRAVPSLAQRMAIIMQKSSFLNINLANLLSLILHIEATPAMTMYAAITNDGAKDAAFRAIGQEILKDEDKKLELAKIMKKFNKCEGKRNLIAHGCWAAVKSDPNILLYIDSRKYIKWKTALNVAGAKDDLKEFIRLLSDESELPGNMQSYAEKDFIDMECLYDLLEKRIFIFSSSLIESEK